MQTKLNSDRKIPKGITDHDIFVDCSFHKLTVEDKFYKQYVIRSQNIQ